MFVSKRNLFFKSKENGYLLFCGNSNSFYQVDEENVPHVQKMFDTGDDSELPEDIKKEFIKSGVLLPESDEERFKRLQLLSFMSRFNSNEMYITIAPTMACNFKCVYCFEGNRTQNISMSKEVMDGIIEFIKKRDCKVVNLSWFGGEPLCAFDKIMYLSEKIKELKIPVLNQEMITNGSLLDENKIEFLINNNITRLQITLDGDEKMHNLKRPMKNGGNSYQAVMTALDKIYHYYTEKGKKISTNIRVNVDKNNVDLFHTIYDDLNNKYNHFFYVYPAFISKESEQDCHAESCLNDQDSSEFILELAQKYSIRAVDLYPLRNRLMYCGVNRINMYLIGCNGDIYRCYEDINIQEKRIGNVLTGIKDINNVIQKEVMESSGFEDEQCKECLFLYSCMGGCPKKRIMNRKLNKQLNPVCTSIKNKPQEYLEAYYKIKQAK